MVSYKSQSKRNRKKGTKSNRDFTHASCQAPREFVGPFRSPSLLSTLNKQPHLLNQETQTSQPHNLCETRQQSLRQFPLKNHASAIADLQVITTKLKLVAQVPFYCQKSCSSARNCSHKYHSSRNSCTEPEASPCTKSHSMQNRKCTKTFQAGT